MKTRAKQRRTLKDPFAVFKHSTAEAFSFLDSFDFETVSTTVQPPECEIKYRNYTTGVTITYEWGGVVWVDLSRLSRKGDETVEAERYGLDLLMLECLPDRDTDYLHPSRDEPPDQYAERVLREYAQILKDCAGDILNGDFRVFPKLKKHAEGVLSRRNSELFQ